MKKFIALLTVLTFVFSFSLQSYAVTPAIKIPSTKIPGISPDWELPASIQMDINKMLEGKLKLPKITENRYIHHGKSSYDKDRLQVTWSEVDEATSYEIVVKKKDGSEKTYTSSYNALVINKNDDEFITGCIMGGTIKVRAVKDDGGTVYSLWTEEDTIACNKVLH